MYSKGNWMVMPYYQYTNVEKNTSIFITEGEHTNSGAILANYNFKHGFSLAGRFEYIKSSGSTTDPNEINLVGYGPGSGAYSFTATPTWSKDGFFIRGEVSVVNATNFTPGFAFGVAGTSATQPRGVIETGFMF
jgi:hypothetical protein